MTVQLAPTSVVVFGDGRQIAIRPIEPSDGEALRQLFESLDLQDRYRRFFNAYHPPLEFCVEQASVQATGGQRLIAVLRAGTDEHLIAEAGYTLLRPGAGEVSVTVAKGWRGWLGPYLLDALSAQAAAAGVEQLEAIVLAENRPMLTLLRSRGATVTGHDDFSQVHMAFPTRRLLDRRTPARPDAGATTA